MADGLISTPLPAGEGFFDALAEAVLARCAPMVATGDLSSLRVLVPALPIAAELRAALTRAVPRPLLLPCFDTLPNWVVSVPAQGVPEALSETGRLVLLHEALRQRGWFDEGALWGIAAEMAGIFDELTAAAVSLPESVEALSEQLHRAYALRASEPLAFEARVVHELWRALAGAGQPDAAAAYRLRLAALAKSFASVDAPLIVLLDAAPEESLDPAEREFLLRYAQAHPVSVFCPVPRESGVTPLMATLAAAWPAELDIPLFERARTLAQQQAASPLCERLQLVPASGREQEAQAALAQIGEWLSAGLRRIVLITQDRLTARRVRALLEREGVLVSDETGWKLSTSRAAAAVDALIETAAGNAYHRDLLDLCKSPYVFSDFDEGERKAAVFALESAIRAHSVKSGVPRMRRCLNESDDGAAKSLGLKLLDQVEAATTLLRSKPAPLARWIIRLMKALEAVGALVPLQQDVAGKALLELLETRRDELGENAVSFAFSTWRDWLNRELESASFRDSSINSPIVLTPLNAVCLRRFEAAILIGGDSKQLAPVAQGKFFNQSVRRELGLRTHADGERELKRDLELLLATVPRVVVTWQSVQAGEANLIAPSLSLLSTLHKLAWGDDLHGTPLPARGEAVPDANVAPEATRKAAPIAPAEIIPSRVSVSGYASLVACPYRFFARHVLGLGEMDEVSEEMEKSDYGALVHRVLERFHEQHSVVSVLDEVQALAALQACVAEVFAPAVEDNFLTTGWRLRWEQRLPAYLDWQRAREAEGWRFAQAELKAKRELPLADGSALEFYGRIDRVDTNAEEEVALLDYKTQRADGIRKRLAEDVQLPAYALLHGDAQQAAYLALDEDKATAVQAVDENEDLMVLARLHGERLTQSVDALRRGASMPAHGADSVCTYCEMSGLCRREYV